MQKIATRVFIYASIAFGIIGILMIINSSGQGPLEQGSSTVGMVLGKLLFVCVFIILPSFALSVAGKYLNGKF